MLTCGNAANNVCVCVCVCGLERFFSALLPVHLVSIAKSVFRACRSVCVCVCVCVCPVCVSCRVMCVCVREREIRERERDSAHQ